MDLSPANWDQAEAADTQLHDLLLQLLGEDALILVDTPEVKEGASRNGVSS